MVANEMRNQKVVAATTTSTSTLSMTIPRAGEPDTEPQLVRGLGLGSATALNMIDMIAWGVHSIR